MVPYSKDFWQGPSKPCELTPSMSAIERYGMGKKQEESPRKFHLLILSSEKSRHDVTKQYQSTIDQQSWNLSLTLFPSHPTLCPNSNLGYSFAVPCIRHGNASSTAGNTFRVTQKVRALRCVADFRVPNVNWFWSDNCVPTDRLIHWWDSLSVRTARYHVLESLERRGERAVWYRESQGIKAASVECWIMDFGTFDKFICFWLIWFTPLFYFYLLNPRRTPHSWDRVERVISSWYLDHQEISVTAS